MAVHQPQLGYVAELYVLGNLLRHKMAMVINDGHVLGAAMVKLPGGVVGKQEIGVDECHCSMGIEKTLQFN